MKDVTSDHVSRAALIIASNQPCSAAAIESVIRDVVASTEANLSCAIAEGLMKVGESTASALVLRLAKQRLEEIRETLDQLKATR